MRKALGKGIEALIPKVSRVAPMEVVSIDINKIKPNKYVTNPPIIKPRMKIASESLSKFESRKAPD